MTTGRAIELAVAAVFLLVGVILYRRREQGDSYGSQGAVLLFAVSAIMGIHALGGLDYHPSKAEAEYFREHSQ
jgi:hypothetical protein